MKTTTKLIGLALFFSGGGLLVNAWSNSGLSTVQMNQLAVANVNGGDGEFIASHSFMFIQQYALFIWCLISLVIFWVSLKSDIWRIITKTSIVLFCVFPFITSCKQYQTPVYTNIKNNETAFVIPLEGDTKQQAKFDSKTFLENHKVGTKRIEVPTRWSKTGRGESDGKYIPTVIVIVVDRSPVTRNWEAVDKGKDSAIWVESSDSVGFSMGFNCTAFIMEDDTSTFLYWYSSGSLSGVMDSEIRGRIQQVAAEECAKYPLDDLRNRKNEVATSVRDNIIPFFKERGITITTVGMFGGMTYENPKIQDAIDNVFVSQQEKNVAMAKFDTQKKENERVILEAEGVAKQRQIQSEAEAKAITALTQAVANGGANYLQLKSLEVQLKQTEKWNGQLPTITSGATPLIDAGRFLNK